MQSQNADEYTRFEKAFIDADDAFRRDFSVIYGTEQQRAKVHFDHIKRIWKAWEKPSQCMHRGCTKPTIRHSHSIQKSAYLEYLAENQHVLTPRLDARGRLGMKHIGVNLASTFPGFCEDHEQIFSEFESVGGVSSPRHFGLQAFRTLCREIFRKKHEIANLESMINQYREARSNYYVSAVQKAVSDATVRNIKIKGDGMERFATSHLQDSRRVLRELEGDLYNELFEYIHDERREPCLQILSLPFEVPVACSGFGNLTYKHRNKRKDAFCPLGILPQSGKTFAYFATTWKHSAIANTYFAKMGAGFGALNAMESWLINGSDHWFIRPSAWTAIPLARQARILERIMKDDDNIGSFLSFSIFDDARRQIIAWIHEGLNDAEAKDRQKILKMMRKESAKITE